MTGCLDWQCKSVVILRDFPEEIVHWYIVWVGEIMLPQRFMEQRLNEHCDIVWMFKQNIYHSINKSKGFFSERNYENIHRQCGPRADRYKWNYIWGPYICGLINEWVFLGLFHSYKWSYNSTWNLNDPCFYWNSGLVLEGWSPKTDDKQVPGVQH